MAALVKPRCCAGSHPAFVPAVAVCTEPGALLSPHLRSALLSSPFLCFPLPVPQLCPQLHGPIPPHVPSFHARAALQRCGATQPGAVRCSALDARRRGVEFLSSTFGLPLESAAGRSSADPLQAVALAKHRRACKGLLREDALIAIQYRKAPWCVGGGGGRSGHGSCSGLCLHGHTSSTNCRVQTGCAALALSARPSVAPAASWARQSRPVPVRSAGSSVRGLLGSNRDGSR